MRLQKEKVPPEDSTAFERMRNDKEALKEGVQQKFIEFGDSYK